MAITLPYILDFVPLDILTAAEMNQMAANDQYLANVWNTSDTNGIIQPLHLGSDMLKSYFVAGTSLSLPAGKYVVFGMMEISGAGDMIMNLLNGGVNIGTTTMNASTTPMRFSGTLFNVITNTATTALTMTRSGGNSVQKNYLMAIKLA